MSRWVRLKNALSALKHEDLGKTSHGGTDLRAIVNEKNEGGVLRNPLEFLALKVLRFLVSERQQVERVDVLVQPSGCTISVRPSRNRRTFVDSSTSKQTAHGTMRMRVV
jgi:hypothetical protein